MNIKKNNELDEFFRKGLKDPVEPVFREDDWETLERMLDKRKNRTSLVYWLPVLSGVAALLLIFLGWWMLRPKVDNGTSLVKQIHKQDHPGTSGGAIRQPVDQQAMLKSVEYTKNIKRSNASHTGTYLASSAVESRRGFTGHFGANNQGPTRNTGVAASLLNIQKRDGGESGLNGQLVILSSVSPKPVFEPGSINSPGISERLIQPQTITGPKDNYPKTKVKPGSAFRPQYALTILAAPDLNGVGSFQQSKVGTNVGLQFSAAVSKKFTVTTGVIYSAKPYLTNFDTYHTSYTFPVTPVNVTADCRMLDIPLNVGYQVYSKRQNRISIGTGLSSYLMLHENYTFNYAAPTYNSYGYSYTSPTSYTVPHSKSYLLGVFNLNATYERPISSKIDIAVEPYLKLPLSNIGYSQVRLQSTGVAVGLKWNLNSSAKP